MRKAERRLRNATSADVAALAALEAACEPPEICVGAAVLGQRCDGTTIVATSDETIVGALCSTPFTHLGELVGCSATRAHQLRRDGAGLLLVNSIWLADGDAEHEKLEAELLRYAMLRALQAGRVRHVLLPTRCPAGIMALEHEAGLLALRAEPHVERQLARGAKLLQHLLNDWWPANGDEPTGALPSPDTIVERAYSHAACVCVLAAVAAGLLMFALQDVADADELFTARIAVCEQPDTLRRPQQIPHTLAAPTPAPLPADAARFVSLACAPRWADRSPRPLESRPLSPAQSWSFTASRRSTEEHSRRASVEHVCAGEEEADEEKADEEEADEEEAAEEGGACRLSAGELLEQVIAEVRALVEIDADFSFDADVPLMEVGLDSYLVSDFTRAVQHLVPTRLNSTLVFEYGTARAIAAYMWEASQPPSALPTPAPSFRSSFKAGSPRSVGEPQLSHDAPKFDAPIALRGPVGRWPGGVRDGRSEHSLQCACGDAVRTMPLSRWVLHSDGRSNVEAFGQPIIGQFGALLDAECFDQRAFGVVPSEAAAMDPQQRLLLESGYESLSRAGERRAMLMGSDAAVVVGLMNADHASLGYAKMHMHISSDSARGAAAPTLSFTSVYAATSSAPSIASGRLAYALGLCGPCATVDTACSSALAALHHAVHCVRRLESNLAIVAAASLILHLHTSSTFANAGMLSPDGRCKTFDARANGYVRAEAVSAIVVECRQGFGAQVAPPAIELGGCAVRQDGRSASLTAPSGSSQSCLLREVLERMGADEPAGALESHGTGTALGDPTEVRALAQVYEHAEAPTALAGGKASFGHAEPVAGFVGLSRAMTAIVEASTAGVSRLRMPNRTAVASLEAGQLHVSAQSAQSAATARNARAMGGVSSFGYSGTIAHVIATRQLALRSSVLKWPVMQVAQTPLTRHAASGLLLTARMRYRRHVHRWLEPVHPLLQRRITPAPPQLVARFSTGVTGVFLMLLREHCVLGRAICPASAYLEMARAAEAALAATDCAEWDASHRPSPACTLERVTFIAPLILSGSTAVAMDDQVELRVAATSWEVRCGGDEDIAPHEATVHCTGGRGDVGGGWTCGMGASASAAAVEALAARGEVPMTSSNVYSQLHAAGLQYGPEYRRIAQLFSWSGHSPRQRLACLTTDGTRTARLRAHWVHPAEVDAAFQACVMPRAPGELRLPFSINHVRLETRPRVARRVCLEEQSSGSLDITMSDHSCHGSCAHLGGFQSRGLRQCAITESSMLPLYEAVWLPESVDGRIVADEPTPAMTFLLLASGWPASSAADTTTPTPAGTFRSDHRVVVSLSSVALLTALGCLELTLEFLRTLLPPSSDGASSHRPAPHVYFVTRATQAVGGWALGVRGAADRGGQRCGHSGLWGLARVARIELSDVVLRCIDVPSSLSPERTDDTMSELSSLPSRETEGMRVDTLGGGHVWRMPRLASLPVTWQLPFELHVHARGSIASMHFDTQSTAMGMLQPPEVEIEIRAAGLNFRDVLDVLGLYPQTQGQPFAPGDDCAGVLSRVGELSSRTVGDAAYGSPGFAYACSCFASFAHAVSPLVVPMPQVLTFEQACTLPTTFSTVHTAFDRMALRATCTLLLHAAAGGVGLVACEYASWLNALIIATVGKPAKHQLVRCDLALSATCSSRDAASCMLGTSRELRAVRARGALNSLSGDFIPATIALLMEGACFVEIGKRGVWGVQRMAAARSSCSLRPTVLDIAAMVPADPVWYSRALTVLSRRVNYGQAHALPIQSFDLRWRVVQAYRFLQSGLSVGKVVLTLPRARVTATGTIIVSGGLGGLGIVTARKLMEAAIASGRRASIVLASRTGHVKGDRADILCQLREQATRESGLVQLDTAWLDVSCVNDHRILHAELGQPLGGIVHAAGVLADGVLCNQHAWHLRHVMASKSIGGTLMHQASANAPLLLFSSFSSVIGLLGNAGQATYAAANASLDSLAALRRAHGLMAQCTQWGYVAAAGMASRSNVSAAAKRLGFGLISSDQFEQALRGGVHSTNRPTCLAMLPADWPVIIGRFTQCPSLLLPHKGPIDDNFILIGNDVPHEGQLACSTHTTDVRCAAGLPVRRMTLTSVLAVVQRVVGSTVDADAPLMDAGVDSLGAIELRNALQAAPGMALMLPSTVVFDYPSARMLSNLCEASRPASVPRVVKPLIVSQADAPPVLTSLSASWPGSGGATPSSAARCWTPLRLARVAVRDVPASRWDCYSGVMSNRSPSTAHGGFLFHAERFDYERFNISRAEGLATDPQHRLLLERSYIALHCCGLSQQCLAGSATSVTVGVCHEDFRTLTTDAETARSPYASVGYAHSIASGRVSFNLGLHGPCVSVDTACSSALVAIHSAKVALQLDACPTALAAAVNLMLTPEVTHRFANAGMLSPIGRCHTFDKRADGFVRGEACSALVLQPAGAATIALDGSGAVVNDLQLRGVAVRQDGKSASLTAPNGQAQQTLLRDTLGAAGSTLGEQQRVETHGTGTALGDPVEVGALRAALAPPSGAAPLTLSGVKGNVGHAESAAGMLGLLALMLAAQYQMAVPNAQLRLLNPHVGASVGVVSLSLPVQLAAPRGRSQDGVSSFGYSGTIAHALLHVKKSTDNATVSRIALAFRRRALDWPRRKASKLDTDGLPNVISVQLAGVVAPSEVASAVKEMEHLRYAIVAFKLQQLTIHDVPELTGAYEALTTCAMPMIVVCNGLTSGGGMLLPSLATISLAHQSAQFAFDLTALSPLLDRAIWRRLRSRPCRSGAVVLTAKEAAIYGLVDFVGTPEATNYELARLWDIFKQIPFQLMRVCKEELPASTLDSAMLTMGSLDLRGRQRDGDEGTYVRLYVDSLACVARLELYDPSHFNSFSFALGDDFRRAVDCVQELGMRAATLQGAGQHFSVGGNPYRSTDFSNVPLPTLARTCRELYIGFIGLRSLPAAVTCAVHGAVIGGGLAASLNCDYIVAEESTTFLHGNLSRGVSPLGLLSQSFLSAVGRSRALEIYMQDVKLDAQAAIETGLVDELRVSLHATQERAWLVATYAAELDSVGRGLRAGREPIDLRRQASEAVGHAVCQKKNSGLQRASPLRDHMSAPLPSEGVAELEVECEGSMPSHGHGMLRMTHIWLTERITGVEVPASTDSVVTIRGREANFCLGGNASRKAVTDGSFLNQLPAFQKLMRQLDAHPLPIISICHGATRGGGMLFACIASALLSHVEGTFGFPEIHRGVLPGLVSVAARRRLDAATCERLICMRDAIGAREGMRVSLVDYVGVHEELLAENARLTARLYALREPLCRTYTHILRRDEESHSKPTVSVDDAVPLAGHRLRMSVDFDSGIVVLEVGAQPCTDLAALCHAITIDTKLHAALRVVVLNVDRSSGPHVPTLRASMRGSERLEAVWQLLYGLHVPIVCTARGELSGPSLTVFLLADYRIATEHTVLLFSEDSLWRLEHMLKAEDRAQLFAEAPRVVATRARPLGLIAELCNDSKGTVEKRATRFASWLSHHSALGQHHMLALSRARWREYTSTEYPRTHCALDAAGQAKHTAMHFMGTQYDMGITLRGIVAAADRGRISFRPRGQLRPRPRIHIALEILRGIPSMAVRMPRRNCGSRVSARSVDIGIHAFEVYLPRHSTMAHELRAAYGVPGRMLTERYTGCGDEEDATSMALTVTQRLLHARSVEASHVGALHIGVAEMMDRSKSIKSEVMRLFETAGVYDVEGLDHYSPLGGMNSLHACVAWVSSAVWDGRWALAVGVDAAWIPFGTPVPNLAGSVGLLIGPGAPAVISPVHSHWEAHGWRRFRPVLGLEVMSALDSLEGSMSAMRELNEAVAATCGSANALEEHTQSLYCVHGGADVARHIFNASLVGRAQSVTDALFEARVASTLRVTSEMGGLVTSSLVPLAMLLMRASTRSERACVYACADGSAVTRFALTTSGGGAFAGSERRMQNAMSRRCTHEPSSFRAICMRRHYRKAMQTGWTCKVDDTLPNGTYYLRSVNSIGHREYEHIGQTLVEYTKSSPKPTSQPAPVPSARSPPANTPAAIFDLLSQLAASGNSTLPTPPLVVTRRDSIGDRITRASKYVQQVANELLRGQFSVDMSLMEAGLDSFGAMEFRSQLMDRLGGPRLPNTLIFDFPTLRVLEAYVTSRAAEAVGPPDIESVTISEAHTQKRGSTTAVKDMLSLLQLPSGGGRRMSGRRPSGTGPVGVASASNEVQSIAKDLMRGQVTIDMSLMEAGLDSFGAMEFQSRLSDRIGGPKLPSTLIFDHPTLRQLEIFVGGEGARLADSHSSSRKQSSAIDSLARLPSPASARRTSLNELAQVVSFAAGNDELLAAKVSGVSSRLPAGLDTDAKARACLVTAADLVDDVLMARDWSTPEVASATASVQHAATMHGMSAFDPGFFDISRSEVRAMDPQQRLLLEHGYMALHDAGMVKAGLRGAKIGVEVGVYATDFHELLMRSPAGTGVYAATGASLSIASGRISYILGLHGPCVSIDTACSSSLVALHYASNDMRAAPRSRDTIHLASGVNAILVPSPSFVMAAAGMTSLAGRSHTFDRRADGFARGEACCTMVLHPAKANYDLQLRGVAVRQDGKSASLTAPNGQAQQKLLRNTLYAAGSARGNLECVETHGTGTALGDPVEVGALRAALAPPSGAAPLTLSGVKANSAHAESGAGLSGACSLMIAAQCRMAVPNAQLRVLNPHVGASVEGVSLSLPVQLAAPRGRSQDGVSSFGYSGTIAHALLHIISCSRAASATEAPKLARRRFDAWTPASWVRVVSLQELAEQSRAAELEIDALIRRARQPPSMSDAVVIGGGLSGLVVAAAFMSEDNSGDSIQTTVLEQSTSVGGVWRHHANMLSRVNSSEPSYRLPINRSGCNTNHSHHHEILTDVKHLIMQASLGARICTHAMATCVVSSDPSPDCALPARTVRGMRQPNQNSTTPFAILASIVVVCTNRRLGRPRELLVPGESAFVGDIRRGLAGDVSSLVWRSKKVVIIGMGAFAIEGMRSALEQRAAHVSLLCRRRGTVCAQVIDWMYFVRPRVSNTWLHDAAGDARVLSAWQRAYDSTGAARPDCWASGLLKPDGHTVSVSDMFFVAHHLRLVDTLIGEACSIEPSGVQTSTTSGVLPAEIIIKCVGFELNGGNAELINTTTMRGFGLVEHNLWLQVEPHLDAGQFASPFGSSYVSQLRFHVQLMRRYYHDQPLAARVLAGVSPNSDVNVFTSSEAHLALETLCTIDPTVRGMLGTHLEELVDACQAACPIERYFELNRAQWDRLHRRLRPFGYVRDACAERVATYPFDDLLDLIAIEAPTLLTNSRGPARSGTCASIEALSQPVAVSLDTVLTVLGDILGSADAAVEPDAPLMESGLESLRATELRDQLARAAACKLPATLVFEHPTARSLATYLSHEAFEQHETFELHRRFGLGNDRTHTLSDIPGVHGLTVCGPSKAADTSHLCALCFAGADAVSVVPASRWEADLHGDSRRLYGAFIDRIDLFDGVAFHLATAETAAMDPQQRMLLEAAYTSLHADGWQRIALAASDGGIFVGIQAIDHLHSVLSSGESSGSAFAASGGSHSIASGRLSYVLQLQGPCVSIDTACSAGLVATHLASRALHLGESRPMSLVAAVNIMLSPTVHNLFASAGMTAPTGRCRTFDATADGYARAESVSAATLHPPAEAHDMGVAWSGSAVRQDGARASLTAPNGLAQQAVMRSSMSDAGADPSTLSCHEAHGTGTPLGDPIEAQSLATALGCALRALPVAIGSVKANVGHAEPVAGMLGAIKLAGALTRRCAVANAKLHVMNRFVRDALPRQGGAALLMASCELPSSAGCVSSFGYSGTIAHATLVVVTTQPVTIETLSTDASGKLTFRRRRFALVAQKVGPISSREHTDQLTILTTALQPVHRTTAVHTLRCMLLVQGVQARVRPRSSSPNTRGMVMVVALAPTAGVRSPPSTNIALLAAAQECADCDDGAALWLISAGTQQPLGRASPLPFASAALGGLVSFARNLALEHATVAPRVMDIAGDPFIAATVQSLFTAGSTAAGTKAAPDAIASSSRGVWYAPRLRYAMSIRARAQSAVTRGQCSYLITGGLGGLGMLAARHLADDGVTHLVLAARSARPAAIAHLGAGIFERAIQLVACDTADACDLVHAVRSTHGLQSVPHSPVAMPRGIPMRGVLHAAGVTSDVTLRRMTPAHLAVVMAPKALAAAGVRAATSQIASLSAMLFYSSVTAVLGNVGQANYAIANGTLDALAACSRAYGQPACSVQPLPVCGVGMGTDATVERLESELGGTFSLPAAAMTSWLRALLGPHQPYPSTQLAMTHGALCTMSAIQGCPQLEEIQVHQTQRADPVPPVAAATNAQSPLAPVFGDALRVLLLEEVAPYVQSTVDADTPLVHAGLDSISAMELRARIEERMGVRLRNVDMLSDPSLAEIERLVTCAQQASNAAEIADGVKEVELEMRPWARSSVAMGRAPPPVSQITRPIVLLLSSPRSGSSLLQLCLNAHSSLYAGQELFLLPFETLDERQRCLAGTGFDEGLVKTLMELCSCEYATAQASLNAHLGGDGSVSAAYAHLLQLAAPRILVDKTPPNAERLVFLHRARELFASARYLHLVRHPYACIASGIELARNTLGVDATWSSLEAMWVATNGAVADFFGRMRGEAPTLVLRYEHLVADAPSATRQVCKLLHVPWEGAMTNPYQTDATRSFEPASRIAATDPKLLRRHALEPRLADKWREVLLPQPLSTAAKAYALAFGYDLLPELPDGLQWISRSHAAAGAPPIACIHDFTGGLWAFRTLAPLLHAPCLGLGCTERVVAGCRTHAALAQRYLQLLPRSLWPDDTPVRLLAYSLGCRIAHRMAAELQARGRAVKLILLDGPIGADSGGHAPALAQLAAAPSYAEMAPQLPPEMRSVLDACDAAGRTVAPLLMGLVDADPEHGASPPAQTPSPATSGDTQVLYVAASGGTNLYNGVAEHALQLRPRSRLHKVDGTHFTFLSSSAHEVAQAANEFLLGATALLG